MYLPKNVTKVLDTIKANGYEAYLVGGCVRDGLMNKEPKDYDIATSARPEQILSMFTKTIPTGLKHGTVTVVEDEENIECTTFRIDGEYSDGRRPDCVSYAKTIEEDLSRRDFTMNAIAFDGDNYIDPYNGISDIQNKTIKAVGSPSVRFNEDGLRMMRCIRFACQLEFRIDGMTQTAITSNSNLIKSISAERVRDEICKILISNNPGYGINLLLENGLLEIVLPELQKCVGFNQHNPYHDKDVHNHILTVVEGTTCDLITRLAALFHDIAKPDTFTLDDNGIGHFYGHELESAHMAMSIMKRLKFDNKSIDDVFLLVKDHLSYCKNPKTIKKLINRVGNHNIYKLFDLMRADIVGHKPPHNFTKLDTMIEKTKMIYESKEPTSLKELAVNGHDLFKVGIEKGKLMGEILRDLMELVLESPDLNEKDKLIEIVKGKYLNQNSK